MSKLFLWSEIEPYLHFSENDKKIASKVHGNKSLTISQWYQVLRKDFPKYLYTNLTALDKPKDESFLNDFEAFVEKKETPEKVVSDEKEVKTRTNKKDKI